MKKNLTTTLMATAVAAGVILGGAVPASAAAPKPLTPAVQPEGFMAHPSTGKPMCYFMLDGSTTRPSTSGLPRCAKKHTVQYPSASLVGKMSREKLRAKIELYRLHHRSR